MLRERARLFFFEGKTQEAAELYSQLAQISQKDVEALNYLAHFYLEGGAYDHAYALFLAILSANPNNKAAYYQLTALMAVREKAKVKTKFSELYQKIVQKEDKSVSLGLNRQNIPCLVEMNGDLIWLPGDLLRFLWHTVQQPSNSLLPYFQAETTHYAWVKERLSIGNTVLDIGSNIGIFSTMMAAKVGPLGRVYAFEPSPRIASDLRRVLALNELHQVTVIEAAASDRKGEAAFHEIQEEDARRESSHLEGSTIDCQLERFSQKVISVKTIVADDFVSGENLQPSLIKIDVESAEFLVLEGLRVTLHAFKSKLVIEFHLDVAGVFDHQRLSQYLTSFDYEFKVEDKTYYCW